MSDKQKSICDGFIYIPQYGTGTASLNVNVATGIILHQYSNWIQSLSNQKIISSSTSSETSLS